ncbi:MAG TPA: response regulator transcription factor [Opitutaceae bacterium]|nr:response regulator transcription factor [Opitutaceae bacterium]
MKARILIAEDDSAIRQGLCDLLEGEGYAVVPAVDGLQALKLAAQEKTDLYVLDVMMPGKNGYDVCRELRRRDQRTPVLFLTAKGEEIDKVVGLELGADDYVTKPFGVHELLARVGALLRRAKRGAAEAETSTFGDTLKFGEAVVDRKTFTVRLRGMEAPLTPREMKLLEAFAARPGEALSRDQLLNAAWGIDYLGTTRTLDQHVAQLRKKIEIDPEAPRVLLTVHGVGYRFAR